MAVDFSDLDTARQKKEAAIRRKGQRFLELNPDIAELFRNLADHNDFVRSLQEQLLTRGELSVKQITAILNMIERGKQIRV